MQMIPAFIYKCESEREHFVSSLVKLSYVFCSQLLHTALTGFCPRTTPACPLCTLAPTFSACSTSTTPGSSAGHASCLQKPCDTLKTCWSAKESTCSGCSPRTRQAARTIKGIHGDFYSTEVRLKKLFVSYQTHWTSLLLLPFWFIFIFLD